MSKMRHIAGRLAWLLVGTMLVSTAKAQEPAKAPADAPSAKADSLQVTVTWRSRFESWDWFDAAANDTYSFLASQVRIGLTQKRENWDWQVELEQPTLFGLPDNATAPAPQGQLGLGPAYFAANSNDRYSAGIFLKQAWVRWKGIAGDGPSSLRLGRFEFVDGAETSPSDPSLATLKRSRIAHRLLGNFGFTHVGRSFDGLQFVRSTPSANFTAMAGRATEGVFQADGNGELDADVAYGAYSRALHEKKTGEWRLFALHYHDGRRTLKADNRPAAVRAADTRNIRITTFGAHFVDVFSAGSGKADVLLWGAWQIGRWGVQDHSAGAIAAETGYQPPWTRLKPWIRLGYFRSSGDGDPNDLNHNTFFQVLPTPRIYASFPFYNLMNNEDWFGQIILRPHSRLTLRSDLHGLRLSNGNDLWYLGGGAFQQSSFGYAGRPSGGRRSLATVLDFNADVRISSQASLSFYLAGALGRSVIAGIYPQGTNARYSYVEFTWRR